MQFGAVDIYRTSFRPLKHTLSGRDEKTMMKLVVDRATQRVVGVHMVGLDAPEIVQSHRHRREDGRHQAAVRRHHGHASDGGRGVRHPAHAAAGTAEEGGGVGVRLEHCELRFESFAIAFAELGIAVLQFQ